LKPTLDANGTERGKQRIKLNASMKWTREKQNVRRKEIPLAFSGSRGKEKDAGHGERKGNDAKKDRGYKVNTVHRRCSLWAARRTLYATYFLRNKDSEGQNKRGRGKNLV